jgi:hypothetical protein
MPTFIYKIQKEEIEFQDIPDGPVKDMFESLQSTIAGKLQSLQCQAHLQKPVIILECEGEEVKLSGFGACCDEFVSIVQNILKLPDGHGIATGTFSYIHES